MIAFTAKLSPEDINDISETVRLLSIEMEKLIF